MKKLLLLTAMMIPCAGLAFAETEPVGEVEGASEMVDDVADDDHSGDDHSGDDHSHDAHSGDHSAEAGGPPSPIAIDLDLGWFTLVVFLVLAALLRMVAWEPIMKALQAREEGIVGEIEAAAAKHDEAKALLAEHQAKIASATDEVKSMMEEARRDAERTKAEIVDQAKQAADAEKARVVREVEQARDSAIKHLAEESAGLAIDLAAKVVKRDITPDRQSEIVREAIGRMAGAGPSEN
ncbi:MAG: F0F1 ATP synthase subunit B [Planctomycetota bacterium]